jgi:DNA ligase-1
VLLQTLVEVSAAVAATRSRAAKASLVADALRSCEPGEVETVVAYLSGELRQRRTGVGWRALQQLPDSAAEPSLTVGEVHQGFELLAAVSGAGSQAARALLVEQLFSRATAEEQRWLTLLVGGELRQGALDGVMLEAVSRAAGLPAADVRRAVMLRGAAGPVAEAALTEGADGLARFRLEVGRPLRPMLASSAATVAEVFARRAHGDAALAVEWKLDGIRVQVHRDGADVAVFTRSLDDITDRVPEVVDAARALPVRSVVLDGEAIALDAAGAPRPFQQTGSRTASRVDVERLRRTVPLSTYLFDLLHLDGADLLDRPASDRWAALANTAPTELVVPRLLTASSAVATAFSAEAVERGHEGVVVKDPEARYDAGRRGAAWVKVKPRHTLDLVVLAAEWGHGRRQGWLSNLHLGARDPSSGELVMLGKTFKGLTDAMLTWQTARLQELATDPSTGRSSYGVQVRPELVVEVAFDGVQTSSRYPAGMALRFARVLRYREDKTAADADTLDTVVAIHRRSPIL